jgi:hypothetical protein
LPAGALVAAARTGAGDPLYIAALGALVVTGLGLRISTRRDSPPVALANATHIDGVPRSRGARAGARPGIGAAGDHARQAEVRARG